jgi:hypothetical protein
LNHLSDLGQKIKEACHNATQFVKDLLGKTLEFLGDVLNGIFSFFEKLFDSFRDGAQKPDNFNEELEKILAKGKMPIPKEIRGNVLKAEMQGNVSISNPKSEDEVSLKELPDTKNDDNTYEESPGQSPAETNVGIHQQQGEIAVNEENPFRTSSATRDNEKNDNTTPFC